MVSEVHIVMLQIHAVCTHKRLPMLMSVRVVTVCLYIFPHDMHCLYTGISIIP